MQIIEKTKTKTIIAVALITLAVVGTVSAIIIVGRQSSAPSTSTVSTNSSSLTPQSESSGAGEGLNATNIVATIYSETSSSGVDSCMTAANPTAAAAGYWDDGNYGSCGTNNRPTCVNGSKRIITAMTKLSDGTMKYQSACVLEGQTTATNIVATIYSETSSSGVDSCMTAANPTAAAAGYWDDGNYGSCGTNNRPTCVNGSHQILLGDTETTGGGVKYHTACVLEGQTTATNIVATIYSETSSSGVDSCMTAANPTAAAAGYWDDGNYGSCGTNNRPACVNGSKRITTAMTKLPDGTMKYQSACVLEGQTTATNIVATIYSETSSSGVDSCMTAANPTAAAAGYWDDGNYGSCGTNNRPTCVNGSHQILLGDTETTGGGVKYHTACVLPNTVSEVVATPTATPVAGTYTSAQSVTLATTTTASYPNGVYIYYTTDGSTPTTASTPYTAPIIISSTTTLKAIAIKTARSGFTTSAVLTALYTIGSGSPYSCTGSDPANATLCSGDDTALTADTAKNLVSTCGTPKCEFSCNSGYALSSGGMCSINIPPVATPTATPVAGTYTSAQSVTLATTTSGATIYYTLDGSTPSSFSTQYSTAIAISATITLKAIAVKSGMTDSAVLTALYTINIPPQVVAAPTANPAAGTYTSAQSVTLAATTTGATIYYTTNGSDPTTSSAQYASAITISSTTTLKAIAVRSGMTNSSIMTAVYTITPLVVATPTATSPAGTYTSAQNVTLSTSTAGAIIRYTLDNTTPTINSTMYTVPVAISATKTLKAIAIKTGMTNSGILTAAYTINEQQVATPTASPAPGTYDGEKNVSLSTATSGASVYYTTNGSTPTSSSSLFGSPIKITKDTTIKAIAVKTGMTNSNVMTAVYKIKDSIKNSKYYKYYKYYRDRYHNKTGKADYLKVRDIRRHNMAQYVEMKNIYLIYKGLSKNELKELDVVTLKKFYIFKHYNGYKNYLNYRKKVGA